MRSLPVPLSHGLSLVLGLVVTALAHGQQTTAPAARQEKIPPPQAASSEGSVHRMVIQEGSNSRVSYIVSGNLSAEERAAVFNLERAENDLAYVRSLQRLKTQYVQSERTLEPKRRIVQEQLYGRRLYSSSSSTAYVNYGGGYGYGYYGPFGYNVGYSPYYFGGFNYGYGYPGSIYSSLAANTASETQSLQYGVGDEGRMKTVLSDVIARDSSPEYAAAALRNYEAALARAASSPVLSRDLGLKKSTAPSKEKTPK